MPTNVNRIYKTVKLRLFQFYPIPKKQLALSLTLGFYFSIFPVFGLTTVVCFLGSLVFRLNHFIVQTLNLVLAPLQLLLIYPFLKAGRLILFNEKHILPDVSVLSFVNAESWNSLWYFFESVYGGIVVWAVTAIITFPVVFKFLGKIYLKENKISS